MNSPVHHGVLFNYPNRSKPEQRNIRKRMLHTINSTWGGRRDRLHAARPTNGSIRIATWTFNDMKLARALYAAHRRGVSVQVIAAKDPEQGQRPVEVAARATALPALRQGAPGDRRALELRPQLPGVLPRTRWHLPLEVPPVPQRRLDPPVHHHDADLGEPDDDGVPGQWNEATTTKSPGVYAAFASVFRESRRDRPVRQQLPPLHHRRHPEPVLPPAGHVCALRPRHAGAEPRALHRCPVRRRRAGAHADPHHPVRDVRHARSVDRQAAARPVAAGLQHQADLLRDERTGLPDPACSLRTWPDPDEAVGDQGRPRHDRQVQPQQVDDDHRSLGTVDQRVGGLLRVVQLGQPGLQPATSRCRRSTARPTPLRTWLSFAKTWRQRSSGAPHPGAGRPPTPGWPPERTHRTYPNE